MQALEDISKSGMITTSKHSLLHKIINKTGENYHNYKTLEMNQRLIVTQAAFIQTKWQNVSKNR